jgi:GrpB-like predicted nucleotidyltransferase (UPF0157 family)
VVVQGSDPWRNHIQFRGYLREHPEGGEAYASLKRSLADQFQNDREKYTEAKNRVCGGGALGIFTPLTPDP